MSFDDGRVVDGFRAENRLVVDRINNNRFRDSDKLLEYAGCKITEYRDGHFVIRPFRTSGSTEARKKVPDVCAGRLDLQGFDLGQGLLLVQALHPISRGQSTNIK